MFYTYILYSVTHNRFYIGQSSDIDQRIIFHNKGNVRSTKPFIPWEIVEYIEKPTRSEAVVLERKLKNLNSEDLQKFILKYFEKSFQ